MVCHCTVHIIMHCGRIINCCYHSLETHFMYFGGGKDACHCRSRTMYMLVWMLWQPHSNMNFHVSTWCKGYIIIIPMKPTKYAKMVDQTYFYINSPSDFPFLELHDIIYNDNINYGNQWKLVAFITIIHQISMCLISAQRLHNQI